MFEQTNNAILHQDIFDELVESGKADWIIGGDWNRELNEINEKVRGGMRWHIPRDYSDFSTSTIGESKRRIDFFICSRSTKGKITPDKLAEDDEIPAHKPVEIKMQKENCDEKVNQIKLPETGEFEEVDEKMIPGIWENFREVCQTIWEQAKRRGTIEAKWEAWNDAAEVFLKRIDPNVECGRGRNKSLKTKHFYKADHTGRVRDIARLQKPKGI